jgi:hypothetical protein
MVGCGIVFGAVASCGGVSERRESRDDDADGNAHSGGDASGGIVGRGGTSAGGSVGNGGASQGGRGGTAGTGALPGAGAPGVGGTSGRGGTSGSGGEGASDPTAGAPGCRFEALPEGYRCENAGSRVQDDTSKRVGAGALWQCEDACTANPACTAITDYFGETGFEQCNIVRGDCGDAEPNPNGEEDAGKHYRKVCDDFGCRFEYLGLWMQCSNGDYGDAYSGATSRADCERACFADPECGAVIDYFWIAEIVGCYVYESTCDDPQPLPFGDPGRTYVRKCD